MTLTVGEAAATYERAMRNVQSAGEGICAICHTFIDRAYDRCYKCAGQPDMLDAVVPVTYSEHLGQMHTRPAWLQGRATPAGARGPGRVQRRSR